MDLNHAYYLVHVVEKQGFSAAARTLGIPKSRISRQVKTLEESLGTRLLNRDSRHMSLTEAGEAYYRHAKMALECMVAAEAAVRKDKDALEGTVTLSCSVGVAQFALSRIVPRFLAENPRVVLRLQASNDYADLITDGIDLAIRGHAKLLPDSGLIQRRITDVPWHLFGSASLGDHELQQPVPGHHVWFRGLGAAGRLRAPAEPRGVQAARDLRPHHARHPHLPRHPAPARAAGADLAAAAAGAMVLVNSVVLVRGTLGLDERRKCGAAHRGAGP